MYKSILVPIDLAEPETATGAIATAVSFAQLFSSRVRLVHVMQITPLMLAEYVPADFDTQQRATNEAQIAEIAANTGLDAAQISTAIRQGGIYHELLDEAADWNCDLIVMASHRPGMRTYFLGSNAGHVVRYATCSVLVVR